MSEPTRFELIGIRVFIIVMLALMSLIVNWQLVSLVNPDFAGTGLFFVLIAVQTIVLLTLFVMVARASSEPSKARKINIGLLVLLGVFTLAMFWIAGIFEPPNRT